MTDLEKWEQDQGSAAWRDRHDRSQYSRAVQVHFALCTPYTTELVCRRTESPYTLIQHRHHAKNKMTKSGNCSSLRTPYVDSVP